jgi:hypothetical protein
MSAEALLRDEERSAGSLTSLLHCYELLFHNEFGTTHPRKGSYEAHEKDRDQAQHNISPNVSLECRLSTYLETRPVSAGSFDRRELCLQCEHGAHR